MNRYMVALAWCVASTGAWAQAYVGGSLGWGHVPTDCTADYRCQENDVGYKLYVGYADTAAVAAELGLIQFGKARLTATASSGRIEVKGRAITLALAFRAQLAGGLQGVARVGAASVTMSERSNFGLADQGTTLQPYLGLGLEYALTPALKGSVSADVTEGRTERDRGNFLLVGAGLQYGF